jgi:hypothetical protein
MRESIGATWIMGIVIFFIILFTGFLAFAVNYSRGFRVKDGIVERIEKYNGPNLDAYTDIQSYLEEVTYNSKGQCGTEFSDYDSFIGVTGTGTSVSNIDNHPTEYDRYFYCIGKVKADTSTFVMDSAYYRVVVFFNLSIPIIGEKMNFRATGETTNIYFPNECGFFSDEC